MSPHSATQITPWRLRSPNYPVPLLHYLECILISVAVLALLSPIGKGGGRFGRRMAESHFHTTLLPLSGLVIILGLALLAWVLPIRRAQWKKIGYTLAGFVLCGLIAIPPRTMMSFSALLLVVVMRACLYLRWPGRIVVALSAFCSFVLRTGIYIMLFFQRLETGGRLPPGARRWEGEEFQGFLLQFSISSALLFGLVLLFVVLMVGTLVTEHQSRQKLAMANQRLRRYSLLVEDQATLQERNRIARELHDSIGHCLTAQSIQLENVSVWFDQNHEKARDHLETARHLGKEALANVRQSVSRLRQAPVEGGTLPRSIQDLIADYQDNTRLPVETHIHLSDSVPKEIAIALYRLIQESLTNIAKHAQAKQVIVRLEETPEYFSLEIEDNGKGFTPSENQRGFGLTSMRERTEAIKGQFQIQSAPGTGCKVSVVVPRIGGQW